MSTRKHGDADHARIPDALSTAAARFFAADWESSTFLEFFVDLQLRLAEDENARLGRTPDRLADHARYALQLTLVRSVDSYLAYLGEVEFAIVRWRKAGPLDGLFERAGLHTEVGIPADAGDRYAPAVAHRNVRELHRHFLGATNIHLLETSEETDHLARLLSLRNLIAHGRTFAADELAALVGETVSIGGLGVRLTTVRTDFQFLRASVARVDEGASRLWKLPQPVSRAELLEAMGAAAKLGPTDETAHIELLDIRSSNRD